jgi:large conductance mechanosensitive channel
MKEFMDFIREQGVVGLAAGFILGGAVSKLVEGLVAGIIDPLIAWAFSTNNLTQQYATLGEGAEAAILSWGAVITLVINLVVVGAVVYFGIKGLGLYKLDKKAKKAKK